MKADLINGVDHGRRRLGSETRPVGVPAGQGEQSLAAGHGAKRGKLFGGAQCGLGPLPRSLLKSAASTAWRVPARMPPRSAAAGASNSTRVRLTMPSALVFFREARTT